MYGYLILFFISYVTLADLFRQKILDWEPCIFNNLKKSVQFF